MRCAARPPKRWTCLRTNSESQNRGQHTAPPGERKGRGGLVISAIEGPGADGLEVEYGVVLERGGPCEGAGEDGLPDVGVCPEYLVHA